jgi:hypothetical protein
MAIKDTNIFQIGILVLKETICQTKNQNLGKFWTALVWIKFIYFMAICNIFWTFGTFCVLLVHFSGLGFMFQEKSGNPVVVGREARNARSGGQWHQVRQDRGVSVRNSSEKSGVARRQGWGEAQVVAGPHQR